MREAVLQNAGLIGSDEKSLVGAICRKLCGVKPLNAGNKPSDASRALAKRLLHSIQEHPHFVDVTLKHEDRLLWAVSILGGLALQEEVLENLGALSAGQKERRFRAEMAKASPNLFWLTDDWDSRANLARSWELVPPSAEEDQATLDSKKVELPSAVKIMSSDNQKPIVQSRVLRAVFSRSENAARLRDELKEWEWIALGLALEFEDIDTAITGEGQKRDTELREQGLKKTKKWSRNVLEKEKEQMRALSMKKAFVFLLGVLGNDKMFEDSSLEGTLKQQKALCPATNPVTKDCTAKSSSRYY